MRELGAGAMEESIRRQSISSLGVSASLASSDFTAGPWDIFDGPRFSGPV